MRDFLWVMDPAKDSLFDTLVRLQTFGESMFGETHTKFKLSGLQSRLHYIPLDMKVRRAIMQIFKEGMNNVAKHANAGQVILAVHLQNDALKITLGDDGCGFEAETKEKAGYGTGIMQQRAHNIGAELSISSQSGKGTLLELHYKLTQMGKSVGGMKYA
ncbi:MAG: hypothetical protein U5L96_13950 [Owenweeksia sp.]|nr:hypothetical protein [Owenweeksia sp.]